jgi:hypothetical protein
MMIRHSARTSKWGIQSTNLRACFTFAVSFVSSETLFALDVASISVQVPVIGSGISGSVEMLVFGKI